MNKIIATIIAALLIPISVVLATPHANAAQFAECPGTAYDRGSQISLDCAETSPARAEGAYYINYRDEAGLYCTQNRAPGWPLSTRCETYWPHTDPTIGATTAPESAFTGTLWVATLGEYAAVETRAVTAEAEVGILEAKVTSLEAKVTSLRAKVDILRLKIRELWQRLRARR